jgi:hypothetical protein
MNSSLEELTEGFPVLNLEPSPILKMRKRSRSSAVEKKSQNVTRKTSVTFQLDKIEIHLFPIVSSKTMNDVWYSRSEIKVIKKECNHGHFYHGLDIRSQTEIIRRGHGIYDTIRATLAEQKQQQKANKRDEQKLAAVYHKLTLMYLLDAKRVGKMDALIASQIIFESMSEEEKSSVAQLYMKRSNTECRPDSSREQRPPMRSSSEPLKLSTATVKSDQEHAAKRHSRGFVQKLFGTRR